MGLLKLAKRAKLPNDSLELSRTRDTFHIQLSTELSALRESVQQYEEALAQIPDMKAHLHHLESSTGEELRRVKACLEQQRPSQLAGSEQREERPVLNALPSLKQSSDQTRTLHVKEVGAATPAAPTHENPALKLTEIEQRARAAGQELSQPTASRYRKQFFTSRESSNESSANDERRAVGEE